MLQVPQQQRFTILQDVGDRNGKHWAEYYALFHWSIIVMRACQSNAVDRPISS